MLFDSKQFGVMRSSLEGLAIQQKAILHNIANVETPGYKAKNVSFEDVMKGQQGRYDLKAHIYTDTTTASRPDGNNVDADNESLKLYENYVQQLYLYQKISGQFSNLSYVLNQSAR